jgi:hypothetical protein
LMFLSWCVLVVVLLRYFVVLYFFLSFGCLILMIDERYIYRLKQLSECSIVSCVAFHYPHKLTSG